MDAKDTWPVVKFVIAATGFKRRDARKMLDEIPEERYSQLYLLARAWDRDTSHQASKQLGELLGTDSLKTLAAATSKAKMPSTSFDDSEPEEDEEPKKHAKKKTRK